VDWALAIYRRRRHHDAEIDGSRADSYRVVRTIMTVVAGADDQDSVL